MFLPVCRAWEFLNETISSLAESVRFAGCFHADGRREKIPNLVQWAYRHIEVTKIDIARKIDRIARYTRGTRCAVSGLSLSLFLSQFVEKAGSRRFLFLYPSLLE